MITPWIRMKDLPEYYSIGKTRAYELLAEFKAVADPRDWMRDGRVTLIRKERFEKFLKERK